MEIKPSSDVLLVSVFVHVCADTWMLLCSVNFQYALEEELQKSSRHRTQGLTEEQSKAMAEAQQAYVQTLSDSLSKQTLSSTAHVRVDDVVRKNEVRDPV